MIGGRFSALRVVAEHADLWSIPGGGDSDDLVARSMLLDRFCEEIGRDPATITRSIHLPVAYDQPELTRAKIQEATDAGFAHVILGLSAPYPEDIARWVVAELITPSRRAAVAT